MKQRMGETIIFKQRRQGPEKNYFVKLCKNNANNKEKIVVCLN